MTVLHKNNNFQSQLDEIEVHDIVKDRRKSTSQGIGGGGVMNKIFYGVAQPRGLTTSLFITVVYKMVYKWVPCQQRFLSCMAFSVDEVVACQSRIWFLYITGRKQTNHATHKRRERQSNTREKPLHTGYPFIHHFLFKKAPLLYTIY